MTLVAIAAVKRRLRESPITGATYHGIARFAHRARMVYERYRFGRYFPKEHFDRLFARRPDPWNYQTSSVSQERKALMLDRIPRRNVRHLLEIGCAAGWMTTELATRADAVLAVDISPIAIRLAVTHCARLRNIRFQNIDILTSMPDGIFDAIVCAGVLVFLPWSAQKDVCARIVKSLEPNGILLLEHTRSAYPGEVAGHRVHALYAAHPELVLLERVEKDIYEVLLFRRIASQNGRAKR
jgi:2-polyprenyl-3-methyl-5-hydroxy-6-metoxy-1,4-benzoquinol methylase